ncbi:DUF1772 domain-containing protein [Bdellovibrio sp. HCB288]|uniref:DUF1772 domain-containing protein n=1 Tax=Bdellovibrio sp. HCB288 TaxID=3394355 RepID=UPI0039B452F6
MKINHFLKYTSLFLIGALAGNAFAFVMGMGSVMEKLSATSYIAFHESMQRSFLSWTPLLCMVVLFKLVTHLLMLRKQWKHLEFFFVLFTLLCVVNDLLITWTGFVPLNQLIRVWGFQGPPNDWEAIRSQWLNLMYWRCSVLTAGFSFLILSALIRRTESPISKDVAVAV